LKREVGKIWDDIKKPANLQKHSYSKFFNVELHTIRKLKPTNNVNFIEDVAALRKRLVDPTDPRYLFKEFDPNFNLPLHDLPIKNSTYQTRRNKFPALGVRQYVMRCFEQLSKD
jgi:hypothetical protein